MRPTTAIVLSFSILALLAGFLFVSRGAGANDRRYSYWDEDIENFVRYKIATTYVDSVRREGRAGRLLPRDERVRALRPLLRVHPRPRSTSRGARTRAAATRASA